MKYYKVDFSVEPRSEEACDVLSALLAEAGFETFVPTDEGLEAYVQQSVYDEQAVVELTMEFLMPGVKITFQAQEAPDEDWNQTWEEEGFEPIIVDELVCVHDTKHASPLPCQYDIVINPRMAFGTGTHPTTRQILRKLCQMDLHGLRVVDAGCGTGVLGILAAMRGAKEVFSYDIDSWSVENTRVNAELNSIACMDVREGDVSVLPQTCDYDLLIANINRNILLADMPRFVQALRRGGHLLLSGFYEADVPLLVEKGLELGLVAKEQCSEQDWAVLLFCR